ncbi:unnamed protein product [Miscanthus lutarioriparius]|uniref:Uncharacterized protein n=1 Tax=Miscanthus lutarioriparius TaxID=422564 RepID=A0A811NPC0_9POAL|nr:unnamed protein product [Miscanthus lutarioriparius]
MASNDSRRLRFCYLATFSVTPHMREEESKERQRRRLTGPPVDLLLSMRIRNGRSSCFGKKMDTWSCARLADWLIIHEGMMKACGHDLALVASDPSERPCPCAISLSLENSDAKLILAAPPMDATDVEVAGFDFGAGRLRSVVAQGHRLLSLGVAARRRGPRNSGVSRVAPPPAISRMDACLPAACLLPTPAWTTKTSKRRHSSPIRYDLGSSHPPFL